MKLKLIMNFLEIWSVHKNNEYNKLIIWIATKVSKSSTSQKHSHFFTIWPIPGGSSAHARGTARYMGELVCDNYYNRSTKP